MIKSSKYHTFFLTVITCISLNACKYDNEEDLYPDNTCNTKNVSYSENIVRIFNNYGCSGCHNNVNPQGGVNLEGYTQAKIWIDNGRLMKSIRHEDASPMPKGQAKMDTCSINRIQAWIDNGALNN